MQGLLKQTNGSNGKCNNNFENQFKLRVFGEQRLASVLRLKQHV